MLERIIYLDNNATTPIDPAVLEAMVDTYRNCYGNPASTTHFHGWMADDLLNQSRKKVAALIKAPENSIIFTSSATESNNTVLNAITHNSYKCQVHLIVSQIEHKSILEYCKRFEARGGEVSYIPVKPSGVIDLESLKEAVRPHTALISVMAANNETGVLQPLKEILSIARENIIPFHTDATQMIGKLPFSIQEIPIDYMSFSAHKFHGPKGVGSLYARASNFISEFPTMIGGEQEYGMRAGTPNLPGAVGMAKACEIASKIIAKESKRTLRLKNRFIKELQSKYPGVEVFGDQTSCLPNTLCFLFPDYTSLELIKLLKNKLSVSTGSACTSHDQTPSHVLLAMGIPIEKIKRSIRVSFGRFTTEADINRSIECFIDLN